MGDISDAMVNGEVCSWCGVFFEGEHGWPVLCAACWKDRRPSERVGHSRATRRER